MGARVEVASLPTGLRTAIYRWFPAGPVKAVVVGVHGFAEHAGRYDHVGRFLSERGFALYMYDLRGHGRSESPRGYVDRFERFVEDTVAFAKLVKSETGAKTFLLGHSMGGLIAVLAAAELGGELAGLITSGAAVEVKVGLLARLTLQLLGALRPTSRVRTPVAAELLSKDPSVVQQYASDPLVFKDPTVKLLVEFGKATAKAWSAARRVTVPALVLHGGDDRIVLPYASRKLYEALASADKTLKIYEGLRHEIFNEVEREKVLSDVAEWLEKHI
ncbi:MAG: alpha/beta hydrolase [Thermofilum sp.]|nr:alpha/beta hydrolase [Thermofilum sp.]